jgi:hypothetical protein
VTAAPKKATEKVEGVMMMEPSALLFLLQALVTVLVVDFPSLGVDQSLVGFRDFDELVLGRFVAAGGQGCISTSAIYKEQGVSR